MSKRAIALAEKLIKRVSHDEYEAFIDSRGIALIDAELRNERERAADRAIGTINTAILFASIKGKKIEWPCAPKELRAAILAEEED